MRKNLVFLNKALIKIINFVIITTFLCQNVGLAGGLSTTAYKLASRSRWEAYGLTDLHSAGFQLATRTIEQNP